MRSLVSPFLKAYKHEKHSYVSLFIVFFVQNSKAHFSLGSRCTLSFFVSHFVSFFLNCLPLLPLGLFVGNILVYARAIVCVCEKTSLFRFIWLCALGNKSKMYGFFSRQFWFILLWIAYKSSSIAS